MKKSKKATRHNSANYKNKIQHKQGSLLSSCIFKITRQLITI